MDALMIVDHLFQSSGIRSSNLSLAKVMVMATARDVIGAPSYIWN